MKAILLFLILYLFFALPGTAQKPVIVNETRLTFRHGTIPGITVTIPEVPFETIQDSWIKALEKGTKSKVQHDVNELSIFGAILKDIMPAPINVYSYLKSLDSVTLLAASFEVKKNEYITPENRSFENSKARDYMFLFAKELYLEVAQKQLQEEEKKLSKLENELNSLENEKIKFEKMIQSNRESIRITKDERVVLNSDGASLKLELESQAGQYEGMGEGTTKVEKKNYIDELEKKSKNNAKDIESGEKKIVDWQNEINNAEKDGLPNNRREQERLRIEIDDQKQVVNTYSTKYNTIKDYK